MPTRAPARTLNLKEAAAVLALDPASLLLLILARLIPARFDRKGRLRLRRSELRDFSLQLAARLQPGQSFSKALAILVRSLKKAMSQSRSELWARVRAEPPADAPTPIIEAKREEIDELMAEFSRQQQSYQDTETVGRIPRKSRRKRRKKPEKSEAIKVVDGEVEDTGEDFRSKLQATMARAEEAHQRFAQEAARRGAEEERRRTGAMEAMERAERERVESEFKRVKDAEKRKAETVSKSGQKAAKLGKPKLLPRKPAPPAKRPPPEPEVKTFTFEPPSDALDGDDAPAPDLLVSNLVPTSSVPIDAFSITMTDDDAAGGEAFDFDPHAVTMTEGSTVSYQNFNEAMDELGVDEDELKKLVSQGELRGFRDGSSMQFKNDDLLNLKEGRETEPTIILTDSDQDMSISESYDELILEDSTSDSVISIGDIMGGGGAARASGLASARAPGPPIPVPSPKPTARRMTRSGAVFSSARMPPPQSAPEMARRSKGGMGIAGAIVGAPIAGLGALAGAAGRAISRAAKSEPAPETSTFRAAKAKKRGAPARPQPEPSPAEPAQRAQAQARTKQVEIEEVQRRTTVRYYKQMYSGKNYPLFVIISQHKIKKIVDVLVGQASSKKAFNIKKSNPIVHIRPIFPGCHCVPLSQDLDVTERIAESQFWLTPTSVGLLEDAKVEILYEGKVVDTIPIEAVATTQARAKISGSLAFVTTTFGPAFKSLGAQLSEHGADWIGDVVTFAGSSSAPYLTSGVLALSSALFYLWNRPQKAPDLEAFFDYEAAQGPPGDPQVLAQRCRLVLLSRSQRQIFEIGELLTTFGKASDRLIRLTERGIENQHCALRFDPDRQVFSLEAGAGAVEIDGVATEGTQDLRRDAVIKLGNEVSLWFFDERADEGGLDHPSKRHQAQQVLERELASFVSQIRKAFAEPKHKTVRRVVAALMVEGILTPQHWSRIRRASGL